MTGSSITKTQRWLGLISYLVGRQYPVELSEPLDRLGDDRDNQPA
jgi:hypothetical protein